MLRSLLDEIVRRRLWPIPAVALLIAVAAPVLFLKSAPQSAPPATALAPAAATEGELPQRAQELLATTERAARNAGKAKGQDPFEPPTSHKATSSDEASGSGNSASSAKDTSAAPGTTGNPIPVVITGADGERTSPTTDKTSPTNDKISPTNPTVDDVTPPVGSTPSTLSSAAVDVRFGEKLPTHLRRSIPRLQTFVADGTILAIFVKYSPNRDKAVFAISPSTLVTGDVDCRRKDGVCRYVDIPAGKHARLTVMAKDGSLVSRRLDVVNIDSSRSGTSAQVAAAGSGTSQADSKCLLSKLLALGLDDQRFGLDACDK